MRIRSILLARLLRSWGDLGLSNAATRLVGSIVVGFVPCAPDGGLFVWFVGGAEPRDTDNENANPGIPDHPFGLFCRCVLATEVALQTVR